MTELSAIVHNDDEDGDEDDDDIIIINHGLSHHFVKKIQIK